jgi:hypothetical protein
MSQFFEPENLTGQSGGELRGGIIRRIIESIHYLRSIKPVAILVNEKYDEAFQWLAKERNKNLGYRNSFGEVKICGFPVVADATIEDDCFRLQLPKEIE